MQNQGMHDGKQSVRFDSIPDFVVEKVRSADLVAVLTGHSCVDNELVVRSARFECCDSVLGYNMGFL